MDETDKTIVFATAAVVAPLAALAVVLKVRSRQLGNKMKLRSDIQSYLQKAKTASTEDEQYQWLAMALAAWDKLDPKKFKIN